MGITESEPINKQKKKKKKKNSNMRSVFTKSIKFVERPSVEHLKRQLDLIITCFNRIIDHEDHLDLMMDLETYVQSPKSAQATGRAMDTSVMLRAISVEA